MVVRQVGRRKRKMQADLKEMRATIASSNQLNSIVTRSHCRTPVFGDNPDNVEYVRKCNMECR